MNTDVVGRDSTHSTVTRPSVSQQAWLQQHFMDRVDAIKLIAAVGALVVIAFDLVSRL